MAETAGWTLPDKWSEDLVDENGAKLSKRSVEAVMCLRVMMYL